MSVDLTTAYNSSDQIEYLVEVYMAKEREPLENLENKVSDLEERKDVLSELDKTLSSLQSKTETFTDEITNVFAAKKATASDSDKFTTSAGSSAELGNHSLSVAQLAVSDTRVSKQYTDSNTSFTGFTTDQTFTLEVGHPADGVDTNRESISVTVASSVFSLTDDEVLLEIASAINTAMSDAVYAETIDSDEVINASVVTEKSGVSRLILRSENSGYTYRMDMTDSGDGFLTALDVNSGIQYTSGTAGGYITDVGTSASNSGLNAQMTIDGLTFYRDSNNITDAISGVTIQLLDTFSTTETITVNADVDTVKGEVNEFIELYNAALEYLEEQTDGANADGEGGILSRDMIYKNLIIDLRSIISGEVTDASSQTYTKLFNIGIEPDDNGLLSISDSGDFTEALESNNNNIADIFRATDGIATLVEEYLEDFVRTGGTIDSSKDNIEDQLIYLNDRIDLMEDKLVKKEDAYRDEFARLQEMMAMLNSQQSSYTSMFYS